MIMAILPKMGYNRYMPREVVFGPYEDGGIGLISMYILQGVTHVVNAIRHMRMGTGQLAATLQIAYEWSHCVAGTRMAPFEEVATSIPYLKDGWIPNTRDFLYESGMKMTCGKRREIEEMRSDDQILMEDAGRSPFLNDTDENEVNNCRLFLQVETLSELCELDGKTLAAISFGKGPRRCLSTSNYLWPKQGIPGKKQWQKFDNFIRMTYCRTKDSNVLRRPLGDWFPEKFKRRNWSAYYNNQHEVMTVFEDDNLFHMYQVHPLRASGMGGIVDTVEIDRGPTYIDPDGIPADVNEETNRCTTPQFTKVKEQQMEEPTTFREYISTLPQWEKDLLEGAEAVDDGDQVLVGLLRQRDGHKAIFGASDGGLRKITKQYGAYGWVVATHDAKLLWCGKGPAPGSPNSSYRTEA
jgi:hypothetical protein